MALALFLFREAVFQGHTLYERDIQLSWQPQVSSFVRSVAGGAWPLWDPFLGFGHPLLADPSAQVFYPPTWLNLALMPWTYYTVLAAFHLVLGAAGIRALSLRLGTTEAGAFVAAVSWMLSGPILSLVSNHHHFSGAAWIPWVVLAADRALRSGTARDAARLGFTFGAQLLAGSAEMAFAGAMLASLHAVLSIVDWRALWGTANRRLVRGALLGSLLAVGLASAQWLPTADLARHTGRQRLDPGQRGLWSVHPLTALETVMPLSLRALPLRTDLRVALYDGREPFLLSIYLGMPALGLVAAALACGRNVRFPMLAVAGALLLALGRHTPVHAIVSTLVPILDRFRYPSKAMVGVALGWALLTGIGFDAWREAGPAVWSRWRWVSATVGLAAALGLVALALVLLAPQGVSALLLHQPDPWGRPPGQILRKPLVDLAVAATASLLVVGLAATRMSRPHLAAALAPAAAFLGVAELGWGQRTLNPTAPRELLAYRPPVLARVQQEDARRLYVYDYAGFKGKAEQHLGRASPYILGTVPGGRNRSLAHALAVRIYPAPPQPAIWGLYGSFETDARGLYPPYLADLMGFLRVTEGTFEHLRLLRLGAVSNVVALHERGFEDLDPVETFDSPFREPIRLFRVPGSLPRAYAVGGSRSADGRLALEGVLVDPQFDPKREVVLGEGPPTPAPDGFTSQVRITGLQSDRVHLEATLSHAGWVVLVDAYDPGWRATVDGRPVPLLRANHAFRAVRLAAGTHTIEQLYRPPWLPPGLALSGLALAGGVVAMARHRAPRA